DSYRTALDLHAVDGATIDNFTALNTVWGNGITLTDSANVTITNSTTTGNVWGGLALYQRNAYYDLKSDNISIDATNTFNEDNPVYAQQYTAASQQFGDDITIEGFSHAVTNPNTDGGTTVYSWFQRTLSDAIDFALAVTNPGSSAVEGWDGSGGDGQFYVGTASGGGAMSVQAASDAASDGDTINILAGTYAGGTTLNNQGLTIQGQTGAIIDVANGQNGFDVRADNITLTGLEIVGPVVGDWRTVDWNDASVSYSIGINISHSRSGIVITNNNIHDIRSGINVANNSDASITNNRIENTKGGVLVRPASITALSGNTEGPLGNEWGVVLNLQNIDDASTADAARQAFLLDLSEANDDMAVFDRGYGFKNRTHIYVDDDTPIATAADDFGYGNGLGNERQELPSIQAAFNSVVAGGYVQVAEGTYAGNATTGDLVNILGQNATVEGLTLNGAGSMIGGSFSSAVSGFTFGAPIILGDNLTLTTTGPATITAGAIDADTAGVQTLTVNAGGTASFGSLGGATRLGATSITAAGTTLTGADYNANSLTFGGPVTLTQALTSFNSTISGTQAGNITFTGNIFGTANGAQSLNLIAGNGAGAKSSNGDVSIQNAGTEAVQLGGLTVNADDFSAATVWLAGDYTAQMTGNQVFTDETLNAGGNVSSTVGGNVSGPINSGGNVNVNSGGNVSGNVSGNNVTLAGQNVNSNVTANQTANITAQNSVSGSVSAGSGGTINAGTVNTNLSGGSFTVNASGGSVTGNPSGLNTSGSGSLKVNGQTVVGSSDADFNQIVVEGFALPAGATVTDTGEIVLPQGLAIGLISPAAGEGSEGTAPRVIFVRSVQRLGALLAEGYSAIVIDLNEGVSEEEQEMAMAQ
ncbi:Ig family protein, partial [Tepidicaulis marinus]